MTKDPSPSAATNGAPDLGARLLALVPAPAFAADAKGAVVLWTAAMEDLTGCPADEIVGKKAWTAFSAKKRATPAEVALRTEEEEVDEAFAVNNRRTGAQRTVRFAATPVTGADGELAGVVATLGQGDGVTQEAATTLASAPLALLRVDRDFTIRYVNPAAAALLGTATEDLVGASCRDVIDMPQCGTPECYCARAMATGGPVTVETEVKLSSGALSVQCHAAPVKEGGEVTGAVWQIADISGFKKAEEILDSLMEEAADKISYLNAIPTPVFVLDRDYGILFANPAAADTVGRKPEELIGSKCYDTFRMPHCRTAECRSALARARNEICQGQSSIAQAGRPLPVRYIATPMHDSQGHVCGSLEYMLDITGEVRSLDGIRELVASAAAGALGSRADVSGFDGNFKEIAAGVNDLLDAIMEPLREAAKVLAGSASKNLLLRMQGDYQGEYRVIEDNLNNTLASLQTAIQQIGQMIDAVARSAEELTAVSQTMSATAHENSSQATVVSASGEQISTNLQTLASSMAEMSSSIKDVARNAVEAAQVAKAAVAAAERTNSIVAKLGDSSDEIGQVIKVINSIAEQTKLLALNATIEAARAGEAGKGFAVVANEVKELAKQTASATQDIGKKIRAIQTDTKDAVGSIGEIGAVIQRISDISSSIAGAVEEQAATTNEMNRNVAEAARGSEDIARTITGVAHSTQGGADSAKKTQEAAKQLAKMAADLRVLVGQFHT
ncbi:MAG TPA: PAS domain-containing protein [Polyangia bacterium]